MRRGERLLQRAWLPTQVACAAHSLSADGHLYVVTDSTQRANGLLVAKAKHRLPDSQQEQLNAMLAAFHDRSESPDGGDAA